MDLVNEVGRLANAHQRGARVNVLHPSVNFLVRSKGKVEELVFLELNLDAEWLQVDALNV